MRMVCDRGCGEERYWGLDHEPPCPGKSKGCSGTLRHASPQTLEASSSSTSPGVAEAVPVEIGAVDGTQPMAIPSDLQDLSAAYAVGYRDAVRHLLARLAILGEDHAKTAEIAGNKPAADLLRHFLALIVESAQ